ncbi:MAG TPA: anti-sigma factor [Pseudonocardiaceae bacterium]|nr:anti-sigma factor [Pseudonocardiaceae bacterium]
MSEQDCARMRELAPELALGVLTGEERGEARKHLASCPDCREYVLELTSVGDGLLALVPGAEPPVGFEDRVLSRMGITAAAASSMPTAPIPIAQPPVARPPAQPPVQQQPVATRTVVDLAQRRARRGASRWVPLAAVAAAIALVFGVGGWAMGLNSQGGSGSSEATPVTTSLLHGTLLSADHKPMGHVWAWPGKPSWLYMDVEVEQHTAMSVICQVQQADGTMVTVGTFALSNGYGHWGAPAPIGKGEKARLLDSDGAVLASTTLAS